MDANKNNNDTLHEFIAETLNESINEAMESFRGDLFVTICQALMNGIKIAQKANNQDNAQCCWHDVNSCLPEEGKRVGVLTKSGAIFIGCVFNGSFPKDVTHYFEIPEPPKN